MIKVTADTLKNKYVFWDFDGVLCSYQAFGDRVHCDVNAYVNKFFDPNYTPFAHNYMSETVASIIHSLDPEYQWVLTEIATTVEHQAKAYFVRSRVDIPMEHIIGVGHHEYKAGIIRTIFNNERRRLTEEYQCGRITRDAIPCQRDFVLIEDTVENCAAAEAFGFRAYHISSLIP